MRDQAGKFRPDLTPEVGSVWASTSRSHFGERMTVIRVNANNIKVEVSGRGPRSHHSQIYVIPREQFVARHTRIR